MRTIKLGGVVEASAIALGCMRINSLNARDARELVDTALEAGITLFDHADIYGGGESERVFAQALPASQRGSILLQTKCGIQKGYYDFSKQHIISSVEGSLARLKTDYVDILLLHRPDTLMVPEEVAEAFSCLHAQGKVRFFGVSNQNPGQMRLLQRALGQKLLINQLQLSLTECGMIDAGIHANMKDLASVDHDGGILEYCRLHEVTIQAWSPFQYGFFEGVFVDNEKFPELNARLEEAAARYGVTKSAAAIAWILRHPARIQPILGTTNKERVQSICKAAEVTLTRPEWYALYLAASGNKLP